MELPEQQPLVEGDQARPIESQPRGLRLAAGLLAAAGAAVGAATWLHGTAQPERGASLGHIVGLSKAKHATMEGSCPIPEGFCNGTDTREDTLSFRDCDGDGILDPYCEGGFLIRFGFVGSKDGKCEDNWPNGLCKIARSEEEDEGTKSDYNKAAGNEITIIHFNDVYEVGGVLEKGIRKGGMSRAMHMIEEHRKRNPDRTFTVFAGDCLSPSVLSDMFKGEQMIDILNELKLDAASLGNHEFDFGVDVMYERLKESKFPWLNINLYDDKGALLPHTTEYMIKEIPWDPRWKPSDKETLKICFFGVAYDVRETMFKDVEKIDFTDVLNASRKAVKHLREEEGCKVVVALTHQFSEQDCELSRELGKDVDLILGGHDHSTEFTSVCGHAPYVKAASNLKTQWVMTLWLDDDGNVDTVDGNLISLTDADHFHPETHDKIVQWEEKGEKENAKKIGCLTNDLDARNAKVRTTESTMANFATDAVRDIHGTDVALINGGTLRGDKIYSKGDISRGTAMEMHPFGNQVAKMWATGKELKDFINSNLDCIESVCGSFVQVSGLKYEYDTSKPHGERLMKLMTPDGNEVDDDKKFTVAVTDYMLANSPMKHNKLYKMTTLNDAVPLVQAFVEAFQKAGDDCIDAELEDRVKDVAK